MSVSHDLPSAPARSRAATRERLQASATELFARRGLHAVTSHEIARWAGVASGTFYLHFKDKREIFRQIVFGALDQLRERIQAATAEARDQAEAVTRRTAELIAFAEENRDVIRILFAREGAAAEVEADVLDTLAREIETTLRVRIERGELAADLDPAVAAQATVGMLARVVAWWVEDPSRAPREDVVRTLTRMELTGKAGEPPTRHPE